MYILQQMYEGRLKIISLTEVGVFCGLCVNMYIYMHVCTMSKQNEYQLVRNNAMKLKLKFYYGNTDK